jgi:ubiquinone/menaquinone biosynthesis C-methylase UbiE
MARYVPALRFQALTRFYDPLARLTTRERTWKERLVEQADIRLGTDVLDLGCGTGTLALMVAAAEPQANVTGLDGDPEMLERAEEKAAGASAELAFDHGFSYDLPYEDGSFDRVLSSLFFHHLAVDDKRRTLAEIKRVLRTDGELHVADWGRPDGTAMRLASKSIRLLDGDEPTRDNLAGRLPDLIAEAGFEDVQVRGGFATAFGTLALYSAARP